MKLIDAHCHLETKDFPVAAEVIERARAAGVVHAVVVGLLQKPGGPLGIYGGGVLSSIGETEYAYHSPLAQRRRFVLTDALRTPYRIDIMQPLYYVLEDLRELFELTKLDLMAEVGKAKALGLMAPLFAPKAA